MADEVKKFNLREEKHVASEIILMSWSPTMDLIALAYASGEVVVNRLSWQRVWSLPSLDDRTKQVKVCAFAWRPDGKILSVAYSNSKFRLCEVEKGIVICEKHLKNERITSTVWLEQAKSMFQGRRTYPDDNSATYLPAAQQISSLYSDSSVPQTQTVEQETLEILRNLSSKKEFNFLVVGTADNQIHIYAFGVFHLCVLGLSTDSVSESQVVDSALVSPDLSCLSVVVRAQNPQAGTTTVFVQMYDTGLLVSRHEEIRLLCSKGILIMLTGLEILQILGQMSEAWEEILREMDSKLLKFAKSKQERKEGSVSNDFLELLLFGTTSLELRAFLVQELTDKGLKKLGYSIENSYSNIQKLVVRQLQRATQNMTAHMSDLHGMSQWYDKFGILGLNPDTVHAAVLAAGELAVSAYEMQQVIDTSIKNFKAFFRWLYIAILRLSNEQPPAEINKMTQHDIKFVADFLKDSFTNLLGDDDEGDADKMESSIEGELAAPKRSSGFRLEKVGQYLKDSDLSQPPDYAQNPWIQFIESSTALKESKILHPRNMQGKSMRQRENRMWQAYTEAKKAIPSCVGNSMRSMATFELFSYQGNPSKPPKVVQFIDEKTKIMWTAFVDQSQPAEFLYLMRHPTKDTSVFVYFEGWNELKGSALEVVRVKIGQIGDPDTSQEQSSDSPSPCERHLILDFAVFNAQTLTLMLQEAQLEGAPAPAEDVSLLVQLPLGVVLDASFVQLRPGAYRPGCDMQTVDVGPLLPRGSVSYQPKVVGHSLAVGGVRTTAAMLLTSQRRIRLFLLDDGDDDEEEEEKTALEESSQQEESTAETSQTVGTEESNVHGDDKENVD